LKHLIFRRRIAMSATIDRRRAAVGRLDETTIKRENENFEFHRLLTPVLKVPAKGTEARRRIARQLLLPVIRWCEAHADKVRYCFVSPAGVYADVHIFADYQEYDEELGTSVAGLQIALSQAGVRANLLLDAVDSEYPLADLLTGTAPVRQVYGDPL